MNFLRNITILGVVFSICYQSLAFFASNQNISLKEEDFTNRSISRHVVSVRLGSYFTYHDHKCGGVILTPTVVLTAAHCVVDQDNKRLSNLWIIAGASFINKIDNDAKSYRVLYIDVHPHYQPGSIYANLALLHTENIHEDGVHVERAPIAIRKPKPNEACTVAGWGSIEVLEEMFPLTLMMVQQRICSDDFKFDGKNNGVLCAGDPEDWSKTVTHGDSGSPLLCAGNVSGIVSFDSKAPDSNYYADVQFYKEWISENCVEHRKPNSIVLFIVFFIFFWFCSVSNRK